MAYVTVGLNPDTFWDLSWREFDYLVRHKHESTKHDWDVARTLGVWMLTPHTKKRLKPKDLLNLEGAVKPSTPEQFQEALKKHGLS